MVHDVRRRRKRITSTTTTTWNVPHQRRGRQQQDDRLNHLPDALAVPGAFGDRAVLFGVALSIVKTPIRAPRANAYAERWVRTVRTECLDWILMLGRRHLERVHRAYAAHYNGRRPHRGLKLKTPEPRPGLVWLGGQPRVHASGRTTCWAASSVNTNSQLEVGSGVCVPFRQVWWRDARPNWN